MNSILLSVSSDIVVTLNNVIQDIHQLREHSLLFRLLLTPVLYVLIAAKIFLNGANVGTYRFHHVSLPYGAETVRNHFFSATPMSVYCFNKRGFALVGAEVVLFVYLLSIPLRKPALTVPYLAMKVALSTIPFIALTPVERLPLWLLAALFTTLEIRMGLWFIRSWGYGINFRNHHFYNHWGKHYRYRHITSNRVIGVWLCRQIYVTVKLLLLNDYFCYDEAVFNARLKGANKPTKGAFDATTEFLSITSGAALIFTVLALLLLFFVTRTMATKNLEYKTPTSSSDPTRLTETTRPPNIFLHSRTFNHLFTSIYRNTTGAITFCMNTPCLAWRHNPLSFTPVVETTIPGTQPPTRASKSVNLLIAFTAAAEMFEKYAGNPRMKWAPTPKNEIVAELEAIHDAYAGLLTELPEINTTPNFNFVQTLVEQDSVANLRYGILFLLALSSLGVYSIILAGWSSNSKYAFIGALRSAAQMISYEVAISLIILPIVTFCGSLNLTMITYMQYITDWLAWPLLPIALLFLIAMLAETNRTPFDLPEAEAELVAGYNVDYSSLPFAMFFLGEYCNMILISTLFCLLFLAGGLNHIRVAAAVVLSLKAAVTWVFFVLVRATLPRYRYDQLMDIGWKVFLPTSGSFLLFVFGILVFFVALPVTKELPDAMREFLTTTSV